MLVAALAALAAVLAVVVAALIFRKVGRATDDGEPDGPTAGHAGAMLSALFLLVFAIAIVVPWTTADAARVNTGSESHAIAEAYWAAGGLPSPAAGQIQGELREYVRFVAEREWPMMRRGHLSSEGWTRLDSIRARVDGLKVEGDDAKDAQADVLEKLGDASAARRQRGLDASASPPSGLLELTAVTGALVVLFPFMAGARPRRLAILPMIATAALVGLGVFVTYDIARVFDGPLAVQPEAFTAVMQEFQRIPAGG
ncbi:DUF4239 domain-containing protein [Bailinhaonella thermotolerans]|uniref:DUF4239 domain-containing protein n=1 Tax=Bailinhaonella thermotolerans TaxID=1070861 RepID=A0A3A4B2M1_9ACTN|nr:DUF4239 domain-containing protein [Bailinhaonella thermotolerans]RJL31640.1 DUF4239 domain-containing protein [Bailinhaonella thermotolerans]